LPLVVQSITPFAGDRQAPDRYPGCLPGSDCQNQLFARHPLYGLLGKRCQVHSSTGSKRQCQTRATIGSYAFHPAIDYKDIPYMNLQFFSARAGLLAIGLVLSPVSMPQASNAYFSLSHFPFTSIARAAEMPVARINVTGEGRAEIAPDMAILQLGVMREGKTAREALDANSSAMAEVIDAMKQAGIEARDLQTSNFLIQPRYVYDQPKQGEEQKPPRIVGYTVSNDLTVRIRKLEKVGEILDMSVTLGVNTGGSIQFTNDDPSAAIDAAGASAMKDAMARAKTLVEAAGVSLGKIIEINESFNRPMPVPMAKGRMMAEAAMVDAVPLEGGENSYTVTVSVSWMIDQ
jgi:uncharacterized protein YggE